MKVREALGQPSNISGMSGKEDKKVSSNTEASFQSHVRRVESKNFEERIQTLVNQIIEQGNKLGKKVDIRELKVYKQLISEFLDEAVGNSHKFSREGFLDRRGRYKVYATIKKINGQLDELTKDVLNSEKDNIKILQRLDDIRGLILDIVL